MVALATDLGHRRMSLRARDVWQLGCGKQRRKQPKRVANLPFANLLCKVVKKQTARLH
jgi:hypothetical protein